MKTKSLFFCSRHDPLIVFWRKKSYNFHFHKNDVTWPLSANGLLLDEVSGNRNRDMRAFFTRGFRFLNPDCVEPGEYQIHRKLFRCAIEASKCSSSMNNSLRERKWISSYSGAKFLYVTSFCCDFVALTWYLCFQCLRWRITYRKFTKNSTMKASKQERYDLVFVMLTCCDFT